MGFKASSVAATELQAARLDLGWTQDRTIRELLQAARDEGVSIAKPSSLKTMLSRWENGHGGPDVVDTRLLCRAYGRTPEELGLAHRDRAPALHARVAPVVGAEMVDYFGNVLAEHLRADNLMGPHHLVGVVDSQTTLLDGILPNAGRPARRELLALAFRYNEFAGWVHQDICEAELAMRYTDRAMEYALEMGAGREISYGLMRKADIAADLANPDRVLGLTQAALREAGSAPRLRALILRVSGRAYARLGNAGECARAIEGAYEEVSQPTDGPDGLTDYCTASYIGMEAAHCWSQVGRFEAAVTAYEASLADWPEALRRDQGVCLTRLSNARAGLGDIDEACRTGRKAVDVVRSAPSSRAVNDLQRLRVRLAPHRRSAEVSDLLERIRSLLRPAA
jgi:hypothetical protein